MAIRLNNSFFRVRDGVFRSIEPFISSGGGPLTYTVTELLTTAGAGTWTKPTGVTSVTVECWGGGGGGGGASVNDVGGGGGGGGGYARSTLIYPSAEQSIPYGVGLSAPELTAGGNTAWDSDTVSAQGGDPGFPGDNAGLVAPGGDGGGIFNPNIGDITYIGGKGNSGFGPLAVDPSGAGGGAAGSTGNGGNAADNVPNGGIGTSEFGGNGGNGTTGTVNFTGLPGSNYGGGGSGGFKISGATRAAGAGAQGLIRVSYQVQPPLQTYTGSNAAYSIRKLIDTATFSMQVQRSSDNTTLDIGFQADGMLDTGSITTFVGSETGYVKRWYDQLGGGYDFEPFNVSPTTWPLIVISGSLQTTNGKPTIVFRAGQTLIIANADRSYTTGGGLWFQFVVGQSADATTRVLTKMGNNTNIAQSLRRGATAMEAIGYNTVGGTGTDANGVSPGTAQFITYVQRTATGIEIYMNGASNGATTVTGTPQTEATSNMTLGSFNPATISFPWSGSVQEIIHYPQDSATFTYRTGLTAELNSYYGTF
jgi:hypothetical protein